MRILQIIDSLDAGGAEKMAVSYANALSYRIEFSGLVATRKQGPLLEQINDSVKYLFLDKKKSLDIRAILQLQKFVVQNKVEIVHAHSTSFFTCILLKIVCPSLKLIWHDHYGDSEFLSKRPFFILRWILPYFSGVISVNQKLKVWAENKLYFNNVLFLPNFPSKNLKQDHKSTFLKGIAGKRITCMANLRPQKNHFLLVEVAKKINFSHPDWTFHLVGKNFQDKYSNQLVNSISELKLVNSIFIYGSKLDIKNILDQSAIALLTSNSEGLPVALLEYGYYKKPVVVTRVGEIALVVQNGINGFVVPPNDVDLFYTSLVKLIDSDTLQIKFANALQETINQNYSEDGIITQYLKWLENSLK
jgi:glycosyltransferase involved in cell wall biosynthesis